MVKELIKCPECGAEIKITEVLSHDMEIAFKTKYESEFNSRIAKEIKQIEAKSKREALAQVNVEIKDLQEQVEEKNKKMKEMDDRALELRKKERDIEEQEASLKRKLEEQDQELKSKMLKERVVIEEKVKKQLEATNKLKITDLEEQLKDKENQLSDVQKQEIDLRRKQRKLEDDKKALELEVARTIDLERKGIEDKAYKEAEEGHRFKDAEKNKQLSDMRKKIEELQRKAEQGSQQAQGEVLELDIEQKLKDEFPYDIVDPIAKGVKGGDVLQTVKTQTGKDCGKVLWETKRTKSWNKSWIQKVKDDLQLSKADIPVIVSEALPDGCQHFQQIDGVWVTDISLAICLAIVLRDSLIKVEGVKRLQVGKEEKKEIVYSYLTGTEFRNRVQAIMEGFIAMKKDLDSEKRAVEKNWAKREKQIEKVVRNIAGMRGDLEGIVGALPSIKALELAEENVVVEEKNLEVPF